MARRFRVVFNTPMGRRQATVTARSKAEAQRKAGRVVRARMRERNPFLEAVPIVLGAAVVITALRAAVRLLPR